MKVGNGMRKDSVVKIKSEMGTPTIIESWAANQPQSQLPNMLLGTHLHLRRL